MNENIKTFCLVVITVCVFVLTILQILTLTRPTVQAPRHTSHVDASAKVVSAGNVPDIANMPKTIIEFAETRFDFGTITEGQKVRHRFKFTNSGPVPLVIAKAEGSCGCTIPTYPKEPIPPGGVGHIDVEFDSSGRLGKNSKTVTVSANTEPNPTVLFILADVKARS